MTPAEGSRWRHLKRGSDYVVEGGAPAGQELREGDLCNLRSGRLIIAGEGESYAYEIQTGTPAAAGTAFVLYRSDKGVGWARPESEFTDGRFEKT